MEAKKYNLIKNILHCKKGVECWSTWNQPHLIFVVWNQEYLFEQLQFGETLREADLELEVDELEMFESRQATDFAADGALLEP